MPTADYRVFRNAEHAITFLTDREESPVVVKADGLAAGKGVVVCSNRAAAIDAVERIARRRSSARRAIRSSSKNGSTARR